MSADMQDRIVSWCPTPSSPRFVPPAGAVDAPVCIEAVQSAVDGLDHQPRLCGGRRLVDLDPRCPQ